MRPIHMVDTRTQYLKIKPEVDKAVMDVMDSTAFINGKYLNPNWSTFVYCTEERWEKEVTKLHFHGDPKEKLEGILRKDMNEKDFLKMIG